MAKDREETRLERRLTNTMLPLRWLPGYLIVFAALNSVTIACYPSVDAGLVPNLEPTSRPTPMPATPTAMEAQLGRGDSNPSKQQKERLAGKDFSKTPTPTVNIPHDLSNDVDVDVQTGSNEDPD